MKAVILAAGKGTRMLPLTKRLPKPMVTIHGKPILHHILDSLPENISECVVITGYLENKIKEYFGGKINGRKITYISQKVPNGTWQALKLAKEFVKEDKNFFLINADDLHGVKGLKELGSYENSILVSTSDHPERFGVVEVDKEGFLTNITEKPKNPSTNLVATGVYVLSPKIFDYKDPEPINGEYFLAGVFNEYKNMNKIKVVVSDFWLPLGTPEDVIKAHNIL